MTLVKEAQKALGITKYSAKHNQLLNEYNSISPLPVGYAVQSHDDWCDVFVTVMAKRAGLLPLVGAECGVERHKKIFKQKGIWLGLVRPKVDDIIIFRWDGNRTGFANHIGIVEKVQGDTITTIEGNTFLDGVSTSGRRTYAWNAQSIQGYARPKYTSTPVADKSIDDLVAEVMAGLHGDGEQRKLSLGAQYDAVQAKINGVSAPEKTIDQLAQEVLNGLHGSGNERKQALGSKYDQVQKKVNELMEKNEVVHEPSEVALTFNGHKLYQSDLDVMLDMAEQHDIHPLFPIAVLNLESYWGNSNVGKTDTNWGGMTWTGSGNRPSGVTVTKGSARPSAEGGRYMRYKNTKDFFTDWFYLLRKGGSYKVAGATTIEDAVKGMFREGGAKYDYAAVGYTKYLASIVARLKEIERQNGSLEKYLPLNLDVEEQEIDIEEADGKVIVIIDGKRYEADLEEK